MRRRSVRNDPINSEERMRGIVVRLTSLATGLDEAVPVEPPKQPRREAEQGLVTR